MQIVQVRNGEKISIRKKSDLTGRMGEILFFEYSEQYPVLLNEVGMFSRIRTYLRPVSQLPDCFPDPPFPSILATF